MDHLERCNREIADIEVLLRSGHPDTQGLCLALADWSGERRILQGGDDNVLNARESGKENPHGN